MRSPQKTELLSWDFFAKLTILIYGVLQFLRFPILPQFMDIYYHLHAAWGFIRAGGYCTWDFWEFAPAGRPNIYPPAFHIFLALLLKVGADKIVLAKLLEAFTPILFLLVFWHFLKKNFGPRLAFFSIIIAGSSFSFYLSLMNHLPATFAVCIGLLAFDRLFEKQIIRSAILFSLLFYTHIGMSWFLGITLFVFIILDAEHRKEGALVLLITVLLAAPIIIIESAGFQITKILSINEKFFCEFKTAEYALALLGAVIVFRFSYKKYRFFLSLLLASPLLLLYPYRFFSAQGYIPVVLFAAVFMDFLYEKTKNKKFYLKYLTVFITAFVILFSPTVLLDRSREDLKLTSKVYICDSALMDLMNPENNPRVTSTSLWMPEIYIPTAEIITANTRPDEIIYSSLHLAGVALGCVSRRATANGLVPEMGPLKPFDPILVSRIYIAMQNDDPQGLKEIVNKYGLVKISENKIFILYKNPSCQGRAAPARPIVSFWLICCLAVFAFLAFLLFQGRRSLL